MMQSADLRYGDDSPDLALLYRPVFRAILVEREMRSGSVAINVKRQEAT